MKKLLFIMIAVMCMASKCEEEDLQTYIVLEKNKDIGSHYNPFHRDNFSIETDYFVTFKNVKTGRVLIYQCHSASEFYGYQKGKKYRRYRINGDW